MNINRNALVGTIEDVVARGHDNAWPGDECASMPYEVA
jgi:hypothetical protein